MTRTILIVATAGVLAAAAVVLQSTRAGPARQPQPVPAAVNVVVILDRGMPADKLALSVAASRELVSALGPEDRLGFIAVGGDEISQSGSDEIPRGRQMLLRWLDGVTASTGTSAVGLGPPLQMADGLLGLTKSGGRAPRIVLVSDGVHLAGDLSNQQQRELVMDLAQRGVRVDAMSPGRPEVRPPLEALGELGNGRLLSIYSAADVRQLFGDEAK